MQCDNPHTRAVQGKTDENAMTGPADTSPRRLACARCGTAFDCSLDGGCWCAEEPYRLPLPEANAGDCLCPACLRRLASGKKVPVT
jgi:hypothetical protein